MSYTNEQKKQLSKLKGTELCKYCKLPDSLKHKCESRLCDHARENYLRSLEEK